MERPVLNALLAEKARIVEKLRQNTASLNNIDPQFKANAVIIARLKAENATLEKELSIIDLRISETQNPETISVPTRTSSSPPPRRVPQQVPAEESLAPGEEIVSASDIATDPSASGSAKGLMGKIRITRASKTAQDQEDFDAIQDWRVRLSLASGADNYLYNAPNPGILAPLKETDGVVFPYTPTISVSYSASYDQSDVVHSNYKILQYRNSAVDSVSITCDFTAQDSYEAEYLLAVIHFLRSATKMFYGKDQNPVAGTPPPLCFLSGLGNYQFNEHPLVLTGFTYTLPNEVDYIRAYSTSLVTSTTSEYKSKLLDPQQRMEMSALQPGGKPSPTIWNNSTIPNNDPTYVPTKMQITIAAMPVVSRAAVSNSFSLQDYASGKLLEGSKNFMNGNFGGIW